MLYDRLEYESDETLPDGLIVSPGAWLADKVWRVRNAGDSIWRGYTLNFFRGERFGGPLIVPLPELAPQQSGLVVVANLKAPMRTGLFVGEWRPCRPDGTPFPAYLSIVIEVR
ncbi:MAG: NBR1-Ig-like domain-containing protein [Aggregatilineales bacterium]